MAEFALDDLGAGCFRVSGDLTFATVSALANKLVGLFNHNKLVLDLSGVGEADSASLSLLMEWERRALAAGVELSFTAIPEQMESIAGLSELAAVLPLADA